MEKKDFLSLNDGRLRVEIFNPDNFSDVHFSARYSRAGYIAQIYAPDGQAFLGRPTECFLPLSGEGFPDEFEMPVGYKEAAPGAEFLKLGVGQLQKGKEKEYTNHIAYPIVRRAETKVAAEGNSLIFSINDCMGGFSYRYRKRIALEEGVLTISHTLENTGAMPWTTLWYSHAFLSRGKEEKTAVSLPERCRPLRNADCLIPEKEDTSEMRRWLIPNFFVGEGKSICPVWRACEKNFQGVEIGRKKTYKALGDYSFTELQVFANNRIVSPEPKLTVGLAAGDVKTWSTKYIFGQDRREKNVE